MIIKANDIVKSYSIKPGNFTPVLRGLDIEILKGEFLSIMGPSGVGKSTLLNILGSLEIPDSGEVTFIDDEEEVELFKMTSDNLAEFRNNKIGFVFQFHHLLPEFTALENVMIPAMINGQGNKEIKAKAEELLEIVGVQDRKDHKPMELSGGEQQRVAIARALINNPQIVLADEPTGNLDKANTLQVLELFSKLREQFNLTFVVATHSDEVASIGERTLTMAEGKIV